MSSLDQFTAAFESLQHAAAAGRLAHAYLIAGSPRGTGLVFADSLLKLVFCSSKDKPCGACDGCHRVERRTHPDISWLEPEKKSRIISIAQIRELNQRLSQTAFAGGCKAGVILYADRMEAPSANAFLKTLEEPPGRCLLLLITEQPQGILPTILSRCQRVNLSERTAAADAPWQGELADILRQQSGTTTLDRLALAGQLKALLDKVKKSISAAEEETAGDEDADVLAARVQAKLLKERSELMRHLLLWHRDLLACRLGAPDESLNFPQDAPVLRAKSAKLTYGQAFANLRSIATAIRRLDRNLPDITALEAALLESHWP